MPPSIRNILFIMCDQLRFDYLSCYGHPTLETPNIDALAKRGVRFNRAYVQSPVCGSSRMSFYTGRYVHSHGATYNGIPLNAGEWTMGDYLRPLGLKCALVGKTHMRPDQAGMKRLGLDPRSIIGTHVSEAGFDPYERDDGLHGIGPAGRYDPKIPAYNQYLNDLGYGGDNPWHLWANASISEDGAINSGWFLRHSDKPARIQEEHSETAYMTNRAMDFIDAQGDHPWCLHLSYIKPHWPYIVPEPYFSLYGEDDVMAPIRSDQEKDNPHPLLKAFMDHKVSQTFARDETRRTVIPAYMGLIKQIDDHIGRLMAYLDQKGRMDDTMILFTADHGDYLGDHWLGEKDMFHEPSVKVPFILYDPSEKADATRGLVSDHLVESLDVIPTFMESLGGKVPKERLEGLSLLPILHNQPLNQWRNYTISEYDYSFQMASVALEKDPSDAQIFMVCDHRWKYIHCHDLPPLLFDLENDPNEFTDLGRNSDYAPIIDHMKDILMRWALRPSQRVTKTAQSITDSLGKAEKVGILIGFWDESEAPPDILDRLK